MKRVQINAIVDICALICFIPSLVSGVVLYFVLPTGGRWSPVDFAGITRAGWLNIHDLWSFAFAALLIIHLVLHLGFIRNIPVCFRKKEGCSVEKP